MIFDRLWVLNLLWVLPFIVFVLIIAGRKRDQGLKGFADSELLDRLCISETKPRRVVRASFLPGGPSGTHSLCRQCILTMPSDYGLQCPFDVFRSGFA
jgi:hypothetical protein